MNHTDPTAETARTDRVTAAYDAIVAFQRKANLSSLRLAQIRLHLAEHLADTLLAPAAVSAVVSPPTSRADLRDRIAALFRHPPGAERLGDATPGEIADAVLAVLGEQTDRAAEVERWQRKYDAEHARHVEVVGALVTDRAAVYAEALLWAADQIDAETRQAKADGVLEPWKFRPCRDASAQLRRLAGEAHDTGTQQQEPTDEDVVEAHRLALSFALDLGTGAPWDAIRDRAAELAQQQPAAETPGDTLPAWLLQRFDPRSPDWKQLSDDDRAYWEHQARAVRRAVARGGFKPAPAKQQPAAEVVHGCPPDGSGLTPCCGRTPFELPLGDRISSEAPTTCTGPAEQQPAAADDEETPSRAHVVAYDDQGQPKCEADCPGCEPPTEDATP